MGAPKAWLDFGGEAMLARTVRRWRRRRGRSWSWRRRGRRCRRSRGRPVVRDAARGRGPLQGLAAGIGAIASLAGAAFVASTDAPFLHPALIRRLAELGDPRATTPWSPRWAGGSTRSAAVYRTSVAPAIADLLAGGSLRMTVLCERLRTLAADEALLLAGEELHAADPGSVRCAT